MIGKYSETLNIFRKTFDKVISNEKEFSKFIKFYSRFYKYSFQNAILIYGQNENATAVADYETWKSIKFQVRKGEKGISLFDDTKFSGIRYVFDVSSTYQKKIKLWEYDKEKHQSLLFSENEKPQKYFFENKGDFLEKEYKHITEDLKEFAFLVNYMAKCNRLGIDTLTDTTIEYITKINIHKLKDETIDEICLTIQSDLRNIENIIKTYERSLQNERNNLQLRGTRNVISELDNQRGVEDREIRGDGTEIYGKTETIKIQNTGSNEQISIDIQSVRRDSISDGTGYVSENAPKRADTGRLEHTGNNSTQEDVDKGNRRSDKTGVDKSRPFRKIRRDESGGDRERIDVIKITEEEQSDVPFFVPKNDEDTSSTNSINLNFSLTDKKLSYPVTTIDKIKSNINAIKILLKVESENRLATKEEKEILANYVGFGGLPQVFESEEKIKSPLIKFSALELKELLTEEEYNSARASTLNAHYTSQEVIQSMYSAVQGFGYQDNKLKILEPSCGTGNFIGNLPQELKNSRFTGVELDSISGRIAKKLYPNARIKINGFEKESFVDKSFDLVIGNVPFGDYRLYDKKYNQNKHLIHDYFINKSLELTKPNGIVAVITSKGTLDKKDDTFRKEIAKKAELIGAIRLPNNAFKALAGTEVTADILFLQKLENEREEIPNWVYTTEMKHENHINNYFTNNPEMILGMIGYKTNRYGRYDLTVISNSDDLKQSLSEAVNLLPKNIFVENELEFEEEKTENNSEEKTEINDEIIDKLQNDTTFKRFRYKSLGNEIYYKDEDKIEIIELKGVTRERVLNMIALRDYSRDLINIQLDKYSDKHIFEEKLKEFNDFYDKFVVKYGYINSKMNVKAFEKDDDIHFLTSLEKLEDGEYKKGDFFYKRTVSPNIEIDNVDNAKDGLIVSLNKFAKIDFEYIKSLYDKPVNEIIDELIQDDLIYLNPLKYSKEDISKGWEIKSSYINGNVKEKLKIAETLQNESPYFARNIEKLKEVIPKDVDFLDIKVDIGSDLYKPEDIKTFAKELLKLHGEPNVKYNKNGAEWTIYNKSVYTYLARQEYGTEKMGALYILEKMLNNQEVVVKYEKEVDGKKRLFINKDETIKVNEKKLLIEREFEDFIHRNKAIRDRITDEYNERFNNSINSNFDIELQLPNLSKDISLRPHQKRAIARSIFSDTNLLLDHEVGAGKTFIMIVSAVERKRLGVSKKPLLVVPNNITGQFKNDFYKLYPNANILYADEKSFETKNRKRFLSKIAQNDYDAIIMGQSQFDLLKISKERQIEGINEEIENIVYELSSLDKTEDRLSIKILERTKKSLENNLVKLLDSKTETILNFEELGIDTLYIDEAHLYKNLYFTTKLRNVGGINQTNSQKALNLKMKIDYIEEIEGKVVFATGTPISNTIAEMYTMQRFLAQEEMKNQGIYHFDSWQKIYAKTETKLEISPAGNGFRNKTRFSKFRNVPELMKFYNSFADVVTTEMIDLPIPKYEVETIQAETSEELAIAMQSYGERAEKCKNGGDPKIDNMLKIVHEGRYAGLDIRHINENLEDYEHSKVNLVVDRVSKIYKETMEDKSVQVIFSDLSTPKTGEFNIYDDIRNKLIKNGIDEKEIAFINSAKNSKERELLFAKLRSGEVRVILGSTPKMGAGSNFQDKLIALYHLDTPWRPSDLQQREGRILRQGNTNENVKIFKCITKGSFDAYSWQLLEQKQRFISQAKVGAITGREVSDIDDVTLDYAEIKALATGNPKIKRKMEVDNEIDKLKVLETAHRRKQYSNEKFLQEEYTKKLEDIQNKIKLLEVDREYCESIAKDFVEEKFEIIIGGNKYTDMEVAGELLIKMANKSNIDEKIGEYKGFLIYSKSTPLNSDIVLIKSTEHRLSLNNGYKKANIGLLDECLKNISYRIKIREDTLSELKDRKEHVEKSMNSEFEYKDELEELLKEKVALEKEFDDENKSCVNFVDDVENEIQNEQNLMQDFEYEMDI